MIIFLVIFFAAFAALIIYTSRRNSNFSKKLTAFAVSNGWTSATESPLVPLMAKINYRSAKSLIEGTIGSQKFWLYICNPPTFQTGRQSEQSTAMTMLSVSLPLNLPSLLLIPHAGVFGAAFDMEASRTFGLTKMTLEGDFSQRVKAYTEDGSQTEVLEYLTPDVMVALEDKLTYPTLFSGQYVSVCGNLPIQDIKTAQAMIQDAQTLINDLQERLRVSASLPAAAPN